MRSRGTNNNGPSSLHTLVMVTDSLTGDTLVELVVIATQLNVTINSAH